MEQGTNSSPNCCNREEDRISRLPNELIHYIMSFADTKHAVQTCVLSKRWIYVWKSLPFLNFNRSSFSPRKTKRFVEFVYMVFLHRNNTNIQKFSLEWVNSAFDNAAAVHLNIWSLHAVKWNVQEITIVLTQCHKSAYEIHHQILNCKTLTKLEILMSGMDRYVDVILPRTINLPQLKKLSLFGLSISGVELSESFFSSCPVLEILCIVDCDTRSLNVDSLSLKDFVYENCGRPIIIKLCAPNLQVFECKSLMTQGYSLENCSSLSTLTFEVVVKEEDDAETYEHIPSEEKDASARRMVKFLGEVYMVKAMKLSPGSLEVLSQAPDLIDCQPPRLCNLRCLLLEIWPTRSCLRAVLYVLSISPNITKVSLEFKESNIADIGDDWEAGLSSPGMLSYLKLIQVKDLVGCDAELKLLKFLLKKAKVLETVAISFLGSVGSLDRSMQIEEFKYKLRAFPAASSNINWGILID